MWFDIIKEIATLSQDEQFAKKYPVLASFIHPKEEQTNKRKRKTPTKRKLRKRSKQPIDDSDSSSCSDATIKSEHGEDFSDDSSGSGHGGDEDDLVRLCDVVREHFPNHYRDIKGRDYVAIGKIMGKKYRETYGYDADPMKQRVDVNGRKCLINAYGEDDIELMKESIQEYLKA